MAEAHVSEITLTLNKTEAYLLSLLIAHSGHNEKVNDVAQNDIGDALMQSGIYFDADENPWTVTGHLRIGAK